MTLILIAGHCYAECHYAECRGALKMVYKNKRMRLRPRAHTQNKCHSNESSSTYTKAIFKEELKYQFPASFSQNF